MSNEDKAIGRKLTLQDIENHLCRQDKELKEGSYFSGYLFGSSLIFVAFALLAGRYILLGEFSFVTFCILIFIGGSALMIFAWYQRRRLRN